MEDSSDPVEIGTRCGGKSAKRDLPSRHDVVADEPWMNVSRPTALPAPTTRDRVAPLALGFVAMFSSAPGQSFLVAVFVDDILSGTHLHRTAFSAIYGAATVCSAASMILLGRIVDRRSLRVVWAAVSLGLALGCFAASTATSGIAALVALALLRTFGQGSMPLVGTLLVNRWFGARRGQAIAIASFGVATASVGLPPLAVVLIDQVGWRSAYQLLALVVLCAVAPLAVFVRDPPAHRTAVTAASRAASPLGGLRRSRRLRGVDIPTNGAPRLLAILSAPAMISTGITFHALSLLAGHGLSRHAAGIAIGALGAAGVAGTIFAGALSTRASTRTLMSLASALLTTGTLMLILPGGTLPYVAFAALGTAGGMTGVLGGMVWAQIYGLAELGRLQGIAIAAQITGAAAGPLPLALSHAITGSYSVGLAIFGALAAVALAAALTFRPPAVMPLTGYAT